MFRKWTALQQLNPVISFELWFVFVAFGIGCLYLLAGAVDNLIVFESFARAYQESGGADGPSPFLVPMVMKYLSLFICFYFVRLRVMDGGEINLKSRILSFLLAIVILFSVFFWCNAVMSADSERVAVLPITVEEVIVIVTTLAGHLVITQSTVWLWNRSRSNKLKWFHNRDAILGMYAFLLGLYYLVISRTSSEIVLTYVPIVFTGIVLYTLSVTRLFPGVAKKRWKFLWYQWRVLLFAILVTPLVLLLLVIATGEAELPAAIAFSNGFIQFFLLGPVFYIIHRRKERHRRQVGLLKTELGTSRARLDFLRMQINPHFLFNALNTIYGAALRENATHTSEAIEKLAEMMRFMLHESARELIPLEDEVNYLKNYVDFQKMRTALQPGLSVEVELSDDLPPGGVLPPMTLIPFAENAFKHGISLVHPSEIHISLKVKDRNLFYEVRNRKHAKTGTDTENNKSGVGMKNIRERLELLYPLRHQLQVVETEEEFLVRLNINLNLHDI